jgi:hypothetical protein
LVEDYRTFGSPFTANTMAARVVGLVNSAINGVKAIPQVTNKVVDVVGKTAQKQCASHPSHLVPFVSPIALMLICAYVKLPCSGMESSPRALLL